MGKKKKKKKLKKERPDMDVEAEDGSIDNSQHRLKKKKKRKHKKEEPENEIADLLLNIYDATATTSDRCLQLENKENSKNDFHMTTEDEFILPDIHETNQQAMSGVDEVISLTDSSNQEIEHK